MLFGILITAFGILTGVVTIFCIFFQVKTPITITKKEMGFIIVCIGIVVFGIANLYYTYINSDTYSKLSTQNKGIEETENQDAQNSTEEDSSEFVNTNNSNTNLSEDELLITQNYSLIQKLKSEYEEEDTEIIKGDYVVFDFNEIAGYMYKNLSKTNGYDILIGNTVIPTKVLILDYLNDDLIYSYSPEKDYIEHYSDNQNKFYCVVFHSEYDIYVTPPIQTIGGDAPKYISVYLNKKESEYTKLFQIRLYVRDSNSDETYSFVSDDYVVHYSFKDIYSGNTEASYETNLSNNGIIAMEDFRYFSLNINYVMDIFLKNQEYILLSQKEINGSVENSNTIDIYFDLDYENSISEIHSDGFSAL